MLLMERKKEERKVDASGVKGGRGWGWRQHLEGRRVGPETACGGKRKGVRETEHE